MSVEMIIEGSGQVLCSERRLETDRVGAYLVPLWKFDLSDTAAVLWEIHKLFCPLKWHYARPSFVF